MVHSKSKRITVKKTQLKAKSSEKYTGQKLDFLEKSRSVKVAVQGLYDGHTQDFNDEENHGLEFIVRSLYEKNKDSQCQISNAAYSAIFIYNVRDDLKIHAGANIDPDHKHLFSSPEHRNCAEKQAATSAKKNDDLSNAELDLIFLYRRPDERRQFYPEMLVPCPDCHANYIHDLIDNNGKLIVILADDMPDSFLRPGSPLEEKEICSFETLHGMRGFYYKILDADELRHLKIEEKLGAKVKSSKN